MKKRKKGAKRNRRHRSLLAGAVLVALLTVWGVCAEWFVHHPRAWIDERSAEWPAFVTAPLLFFGNPLSDLTDALDWTGYDTVCEYDTEPPSGHVFFAGAPKRIGGPAPGDIRILDRGEFRIGWSDTLRHPVWCAYHVVPDVRYESLSRPSFTKDRSVDASPLPGEYTRSGFDRGHMVPNYPIITRYGPDEQRKTFMMSNIAPQSPALNRGVWRDVEHRIADLWTARYGEIWVIVGCISKQANRDTIRGTSIDIPCKYYQVIIAQNGMDVRALAVVFSQDVPWNCWAARNIVSIRELEGMTGLDFNPDLPSFIQDPLETDLPSRLWPIRFRDILKLVASRFR